MRENEYALGPPAMPSDRWLVLLLLVLLWQNGASAELIAALAYIAMG